MAVRATARAGSGLLLRISEFYLPVRSVCTIFLPYGRESRHGIKGKQECVRCKALKVRAS